MNRIAAWVFLVAAVVFAVLALWSLTDANWSGVIVSVLLVIGCVLGARTASPRT